jgi:hypothetical protein
MGVRTNDVFGNLPAYAFLSRAAFIKNILVGAGGFMLAAINFPAYKSSGRTEVAFFHGNRGLIRRWSVINRI